MNHSLAGFAALISIVAPAASTASSVGQSSRLVTYDDLDLSSQAGVATLHRRISRAVNLLCADPTGPSPGVTVDPSCRRDAWTAARMQLDTAIASARPDGSELAIQNIQPEPVRR